MNLALILEMARSNAPDRLAIAARAQGLTFDALAKLVSNAAAEIAKAGARNVIFLGVNGPAWPVTLFAAAAAGVPVVPLNYRLGQEQLNQLVARIPDAYAVADQRYVDSLVAAGANAVEESEQWLARLGHAGGEPAGALAREDLGDQPAVVLFTSGTTSAPKGVILRHAHLSAYVIQTVEFASASADEAALVSVPPYHVAGVGTVLTNVFAGRRIVYLPDFAPQAWLEHARREGVTQAMVVPTMLARIVDYLDGARADVPTLRSIAYGGAPMPPTVLARALEAFPDTGFVNSYGLTETSSTIAVLGPDEHREALASSDPVIRARLGSVGRPVPGVEVQVRSDTGEVLSAGKTGVVWVRGPQVSGEYLDQGKAVDADGWFSTRDRGYLDEAGYLFILGRADDTIIRGGENIAPEEIESALRLHPGVADVGVVGVPDEEWGQRIVAAVVAKDGSGLDADRVRQWARQRLRGSRTPDEVVFVEQLPYSPLGKLLRRDLERQIAQEVHGKEWG